MLVFWTAPLPPNIPIEATRLIANTVLHPSMLAFLSSISIKENSQFSIVIFYTLPKLINSSWTLGQFVQWTVGHTYWTFEGNYKTFKIHTQTYASGQHGIFWRKLDVLLRPIIQAYQERTTSHPDPLEPFEPSQNFLKRLHGKILSPRDLGNVAPILRIYVGH